MCWVRKVRRTLTPNPGTVGICLMRKKSRAPELWKKSKNFFHPILTKLGYPLGIYLRTNHAKKVWNGTRGSGDMGVQRVRNAPAPLLLTVKWLQLYLCSVSNRHLFKRGLSYFLPTISGGDAMSEKAEKATKKYFNDPWYLLRASVLGTATF